MAVKIVRQVKNIALLGVPSSAASVQSGAEAAPAALRAAGLVARLSAAGFAVTDHGDCTLRISRPDEEHPRARNAHEALASIEELRPKVEVFVKTGALPVLLGGDNTMVLATIAGARRYYRNVSLIMMDRDAGLNAPASTPSGCLDGMVISHVAGRGAPELVRFWGEPPLVREPDVALFGVARLDEPEKEVLARSTLRRYFAEDIQRMGAKAAAEQALERAHGLQHEFVLHIDLDVIASEDFQATNLAGPGGLRLSEVKEALKVFVRQPTLAAFLIASYNPALDQGGAAAQQLIDLLVELLSSRLPAEAVPMTAEAAPSSQAETTSAPPEAAASSVPANSNELAAAESSAENASPSSELPNS